MTKWLLGAPLKQKKIAKLQTIIKNWPAHAQLPTFCVIKVGDDTGSQLYLHSLQRAAQTIGIQLKTISLPVNAQQSEALQQIKRLNHAASIHGILLTMPLPAGWDPIKLSNAIAFEKDVDCLTAVNLGRLWQDQSLFVPATARAVMTLLTSYQVPLAGQHAVILGRSQVIGKPLAALLLKAGATVTIADSQTQKLPALVGTADLLVSAIGQPEFVQAAWLKNGVNAVDVGINWAHGRIVGDLSPACASRANWLTPVPGGVGPLTTISLMEQVIQAARRQNGN
ncbi:MAG: bifunctional methylenetetrahydrofolate dehydrogenase/methenyltetrahydrofolate cyclohydrolase [Lactobacillus sp.]|jgi:methylenetetrahydrofolate dehydrogenase (NADP+)/methenyltetrahydrofolate cyclohydrolase|nr:bifunctional methylenetetrahydrofolate dehydrogenase/methenyltetrahydrofolate cyclohydrolase [Lactobacillus sp.]MCH4068965.1 bifunctional methylenetetrahydrofolate dehydrogenase/methenyltetrahydrofolate cyclohydrolase [Lactobacillus sp.]MCI1303367.1 bifunctional methylenetetrahydrofolate dehydrogenase/methenyltetrahydrofolate cyclohydrolase [Lactobacillus sp.]MCI1329443.1 bifunctional methylenetetrahydrofolate dehydrogenase/methenyltetrahydrofolate cyclohydrolase [Lactobacillus sp.]MCI135960